MTWPCTWLSNFSLTTALSLPALVHRLIVLACGATESTPKVGVFENTLLALINDFFARRDAWVACRPTAFGPSCFPCSCQCACVIQHKCFFQEPISSGHSVSISAKSASSLSESPSRPTCKFPSWAHLQVELDKEKADMDLLQFAQRVPISKFLTLSRTPSDPFPTHTSVLSAVWWPVIYPMPYSVARKTFFDKSIRDVLSSDPEALSALEDLEPSVSSRRSSDAKCGGAAAVKMKKSRLKGVGETETTESKPEKRDDPERKKTRPSRKRPLLDHDDTPVKHAPRLPLPTPIRFPLSPVRSGLVTRARAKEMQPATQVCKKIRVSREADDLIPRASRKKKAGSAPSAALPSAAAPSAAAPSAAAPSAAAAASSSPIASTPRVLSKLPSLKMCAEYPLRLFEVRKSKIHGRGVFAKVPLGVGRTSIFYRGSLLWRQDLRQDAHHISYAFSVPHSANTLVILPDIDASGRPLPDPTQLAAFINQSDERHPANCCFDYNPSCPAIIGVMLLKDVAQDEELILDSYGDNVDARDPAGGSVVKSAVV